MMLKRALLLLAALCVPHLCLASESESNFLTGFQVQNNDVVRQNFDVDPRCNKGYHNGFHMSAWQFNVPLEQWLNKTGSFVNADWYTGPINSTNGPDNTIGTTRTIYVDSAVFVERLIYFYSSPTEQVQEFVIDSGPSLLQGVRIGPYMEYFKATSICGGRATLYVMTAAYCADKVVAGYDLFNKFRTEKVAKAALEVGAMEFKGTCPTPGEA